MGERKMNEGAFLYILRYILRCFDGSFYVGTTRTALETRVAQHNAGTFGGYTASRRPVILVFSQWFDRITDAIENERKLKKWSREGGLRARRFRGASATFGAQIAAPLEAIANDGLISLLN